MICVGASNVRPAGNPRSAYCLRLARRNAFGQQSAFHRQNSNNVSPENDSPSANALTTSKPTSRQQSRSPNAPSHSGRMPTGEQAGPDGTPPKALNFTCGAQGAVCMVDEPLMALEDVWVQEGEPAMVKAAPVTETAEVGWSCGDV